MQRRRIVIGSDGSEEAELALAWTLSFAGPHDEVELVNAWHLPAIAIDPMDPTMAPLTLFPEVVDPHPGENVAPWNDAVLDPRVTTRVRKGWPGQVLVAEAAHADLVVVGHRGNTQLSMALGSTANYVLRHAPTPVVIVRGDAATPPRRVVVGVDDHDRTDGADTPSVRALRWAFGIDGIEEVRVVHAWSIQPFIWDVVADVPHYLNELDEGAAAVIERCVDAAGEPPADVKVHHEVVRDSAAHALLRASADADLVVVGTRGLGGFTGMLVGSTSQALAAHSHAPVVVVR